ncbi:hypothetical protein THIOKS11600032 [Thiocapsa sp. KS1]|nr:hypothetical protein THIOKS11600032 [Thiocapsa sp. KS1]
MGSILFAGFLIHRHEYNPLTD